MIPDLRPGASTAHFRVDAAGQVRLSGGMRGASPALRLAARQILLDQALKSAASRPMVGHDHDYRPGPLGLVGPPA